MSWLQQLSNMFPVLALCLLTIKGGNTCGLSEKGEQSLPASLFFAFPLISYELVEKKSPSPEVFFFPVTPQNARDTFFFEFCHGHFWLFTGILSKIVTGKVKNFTGIFSNIDTGKSENSRAFRKIVVTGTLTFVTGTFPNKKVCRAAGAKKF